MSQAEDTEKIDTLRRLGARVPYPHAVPPRRDKYGAPWCPCCDYALPLPQFELPLSQLSQTTAVGRETCPGCPQRLDWSHWSDKLSAEELRTHEAHACRPPEWCYRCKPQRTR